MTKTSKRLLYWAPRAISIAFILFLCVFALDVFQDARGFWNTLGALALHLVPCLVLLAVLVIAWRWEWVGSVFYAGAGLLYILSTMTRPLPVTIKFVWMSTIALPALAIAVLFLLNWMKHKELHARA